MSKHIATTTQGAHPWRAVFRTIFALVVAIAAMAPLIYTAIAQANPEGATGAAAAALAIAGAITRVLALPVVESFLQRFLPWLAASARGDDEPERGALNVEGDASVDGYPIPGPHEPSVSPERHQPGE